MATQTATVEVKLTANQQNLKRGLDGADKSLEKTRTRSKKLKKDLNSAGKGVQESFRRASQSIAAIQGPLGPVAGRITSLGTIIGNVGLKIAAITVGVAALTFGLRAIIGVISRSEVQFNKLNAVLRATGNAAGLTIDEIEDLSRQIGIGTLASTQKVRDAAGILLTFKSIQGDTFREALKLTQDLAAVGFGDVKTGAIQLGKALEEPIVGLGALRRVGVSFTEEQKNLIKSLENTGQRAKAQEIILNALNSQVGGAGVSAADGLAGAMDTLSEKFTIFLETSKTGTGIVRTFTSVVNGLADAFGNAMVDPEKIHSAAVIFDRIQLTLEKIDKRQKILDAEFFETFNVGPDAKMEKLIEQLELLEQRHRQLIAIQKDGIESQKKENEMFGEATSLIEEKNKALEKARKNTEKIIEKHVLDRKVMFMSNVERNKTLALEKIFAQIRKDVPDEAEQKRAIAEATKEHSKALELQAEEAEKFRKVQVAMNEVTGIATKQFDDLSRNLAEAFVTGSKEALNFKNILQSLAKDLIKMTLDLLVFNQIKEGVMTIGRNIGDIIAGPATGVEKKSTGGAVSGRMPQLVGERGPELFVPNQAGRIVPSSLTPGAMSSSGGVVVNQNLNFSTGISNTVKAEILTLMPQIQNQTISAVAEARMRGGKFAKAFK